MNVTVQGKADSGTTGLFQLLITYMSATLLATQKSNLRKQMRQRRRQLSPKQQRQAATQLAKRLSLSPLWQQAKNIALYLPNDGEISTHELIHLIWRSGKHCYLPKIHNQDMRFLRFNRGDRLIQNRFGIAEPQAHRNSIKAQDLDLVAMPLVAYDLNGRRLGMGGGFYDRCFRFRKKRFIHRPILVGLAHRCQCLPELPAEPWDLNVDYICSDTHRLRVKTLAGN